MNFRNEKFNQNNTIDCEVNHPVYGWIPTTLSPDDAETFDLYEKLKSKAAPYVEPVKTKEEVIQEFISLADVKVQEALDSQAQQLGYDDIDSIAKYLRPNSQYYDECIALGDWCDSVWVYFNNLTLDVNSGVKSMPTIEELINGLPNFTGV